MKLHLLYDKVGNIQILANLQVLANHATHHQPALQIENKNFISRRCHTPSSIIRTVYTILHFTSFSENTRKIKCSKANQQTPGGDADVYMSYPYPDHHSSMLSPLSTARSIIVRHLDCLTSMRQRRSKRGLGQE